MINDLFQPFYQNIISRSKDHGPLKLAILAQPEDKKSLEDLKKGIDEEWIWPIVISSEKNCEELLEVLKCVPDKNCTVLRIPGMDSQSDSLADLLLCGEALKTLSKTDSYDIIFLGPSKQNELFWLLKAPGYGLALDGKIGYGISALAMPGYNRLLFVADVLSLAEPSVKQSVEIVKASVQVAKKAQVVDPKVSLLAAVEVVNPGMPVTVAAEQVSQIAEKLGIVIQGPLSMDLSVNLKAAEKKKAKGEVPGKADILIGPNMTVAKGIYQAASGFCGADAGVIIAGANKPIAVPGLSNGDNGLLSVLFASTLL